MLTNQFVKSSSVNGKTLNEGSQDLETASPEIAGKPCAIVETDNPSATHAQQRFSMNNVRFDHAEIERGIDLRMLAAYQRAEILNGINNDIFKSIQTLKDLITNFDVSNRSVNSKNLEGAIDCFFMAGISMEQRKFGDEEFLFDYESRPEKLRESSFFANFNKHISKKKEYASALTQLLEADGKISKLFNDKALLTPMLYEFWTKFNSSPEMNSVHLIKATFAEMKEFDKRLDFLAESKSQVFSKDDFPAVDNLLSYSKAMIDKYLNK
ncbi:hypothetical protein [Paraburkholderia bonniea]|uniref:hypothetical protein n=1 Tax=Paraburkholderia bonniea TaxID=2152891 RepID=UPI001291CDB8|nr:hypothetical protein [Paraburkholderia bonniea]